MSSSNILQGLLDDQGPPVRAIDQTLVASWPLARVDSVMLRGGANELKTRKHIPARVVIKEHIDVAGDFVGPEESGIKCPCSTAWRASAARRSSS